MIAIIKSCGNNLASIQYSLDRLGKKSIITTDKNIIKKASHVILPGVGHAKKAMDQLNALELVDLILKLKQPVLGICLGMQLLYEYSEEGHVNCLGIIPGKIYKLPNTQDYTIPHMGWNKLYFIGDDSYNCQYEHVYFVHSYYAPLNDYTIAVAEYTKKFTAIVQYKNFFGMQFHPERSGEVGNTILKQFIRMT